MAPILPPRHNEDFRRSFLAKLADDIKNDFNTLAQYRQFKCDGLFHKTLMAKFCTNTRLVRPPRSRPNVGLPTWDDIDDRHVVGVELLDSTPAVLRGIA